MNYNEWEAENLNVTFNKVYICALKDGIILVEGALSGVSRMPLMKHTMTVTIHADGKVDLSLRGNVRKDAIWLPRLGFEWTLPAQSNAFAYYGHGPIESYRDMHHWAPVGMYESTAGEEYVPYVRPQEHGNHYGVKCLRIGKLEFTADNSFECNVSEYSADALLRAEHTDELVKDGKVHLRVDYKVSGIGSHSCGPALSNRHRLEEKEIDFAFTMKPIR